jgi:hypothetical protein
MLSRSLISIIIAASIIATPAVSHTDLSGVENIEDAISAGFAQGDYHKLYSAIKDLLLTHPDNPVSALYYGMFFQMADFFGQERIASDAQEIIKAVKNKNNANPCMLLLNLELEKLFYQYNVSKGKEITTALNPIRKWTLYGPFNKYGSADFNNVFEPEFFTGDKHRTPQKRIQITNADGYLNPGTYLYPDSGIAYAQVSFRAVRPVKIRIYSKSCYKIFINGNEITKNVPEKSRYLRIIRVWNASRITLLLKLAGMPFDRVRVIITDERDNVINPDIIDTVAGYTEACEVTEEAEFPHQNLLLEESKNPRKIHGYLALYFANLGSEESIDFFKRSLSSEKNDLLSFFLASFLIENNKSDQGSTGYNEGWNIIHTIVTSNPGFIPAVHNKMKYFIKNGEFSNAYKSGKRLIAGAPGFPPAGASLLHLLNELGYEKDFVTLDEILKKRFPASVYLLEEEAEYFNRRDKNKYLDISISLLRRKFSVCRAKTILREFISRGDYKKAIELINSYNHNNDFTSDLIEAHMKSGDFKTSRNLIFKQLQVKDDPSLYYALGVMDLLMRDDPEMYFYKLLAIKPSIFSVSDYVQFLKYDSVVHAFKQYQDPVGVVDSSWMKSGDRICPSTVLYRSRIFLLHSDRSSRLYCEDIIYVNNDQGVERWSNIKIPYLGFLQPVHLLVYDESGNTKSSYSITVNGDAVKLNFLQKNSIIHLSYIIDNPITEPSGSRFFTIPGEFLQNYDEPVERLSIKVIAPEKMDVRFFVKQKVSVVESHIDNLKVHSITIDKLPAIKNENSSGKKIDDLCYFSFSTMINLDDFVLWYKGLLTGKMAILDTKLINALHKETVEESVASVYDFVSRDIQLRGNKMYVPEKIDAVLYRKQGTVEDKVLLAQALLDRLGIKSFVAFARNKLLPDTGNYVSPEIFTHILLYVPLDASESLWLDFSGQVSGCGITEECITDATALIIVNNSFRKKIIGRQKVRLKS